MTSEAMADPMNEVTLPLAMVDPVSNTVRFDFVADPAVMRERITRFAHDLMAAPGKFTELPLDHSFCDGMYIRRLMIPQYSLIVGHIHRQDCINVVEKGELSVLTENGFARLGPGYLAASPAGLQKIGYAHQDTIFTNIFSTEETDIGVLEKVLIWESHDAMKQEVLCR